MKKLTVEAVAQTNAPVEKLWALLADTEAYARWGIWDEAVVVSTVDGQLIDTVRRLRLGRTNTVERITDADAPNRMSYTVVSGIPVRDYSATVELTVTETGTSISWRASWNATIPGRFVLWKLRKLYPTIVERLATAAESDVGVNA